MVRQIWGDPTDIVDFVYVGLSSSRTDGVPVAKTIVNDRAGNVKEYVFDHRNLEVSMREYTGRADPGLPTTETDNRPTGQLRLSDPPFFETSREWNDDALPTRVIHPNGNITEYVYESDLDPAAPPRIRANLRTLRRLPGTHTPAGDQAVIEEQFEYHPDFGGSSDFVTRHVDGRGNETLHSYDASGNRTQTTHRIPSIKEDFEYNAFGQRTKHIHPDNGSGSRREDVFTYYTQAEDDDQEGYLKEAIIDAPNFALTTIYEYDLVGNVVRETDPRGHDTQYFVNELNQVVRETSREVTDGSGVRYERDTFYDANDNVIRLDVQNVDDAGVLQANTHFTETYEYEILNYPVRMTQEVEPGVDIVTEYAYDPNRNQTLVRFGEATNGNQPTNTLTTVYDERDLVFQEIRASGDAGQSTTEYDYDRNRNRAQVREGIESTPQITARTYDAYDRELVSVDPMGNATTYEYDPNGNQVGMRVDGELVDVPGDLGNVRLDEATYVYDALDRRTREEVAFFDTDSQSAIDDGLAVTEIAYSDFSGIVSRTDDNNHTLAFAFDTANRLSVVTDPMGNTETRSYDANSNVTGLTTVEKSDLGGPDETYVTLFGLDNLDRRTSTTDNVGNVTSLAYDSRDNRTRSTDALGNLVTFEYDGLNRLISTDRVLTDDGTGAGTPIGSVTTTQAWDDSSRLIERVDPNTNPTTYAYDALDRRTLTVFADLTTHATTYDVHDNAVTVTDQNGTVVFNAFDLLDRHIGTTVALGAGVSSDTTFEVFEYDGRSRNVRAEDDDTLVTMSYDSLSRVTRETLNGETTSSLYDGVGNQVACTYPGGRAIVTTYDDLDRQSTISDGSGLIATFDYVGPERVERREYGNGTRTDYVYDGIANAPGDFGVKQIVATTHSVVVGGAIRDDRVYQWDPLYNKTLRQDVRGGGPQLTHEYAYDSIYRLRETTATDPVPSVLRQTVYDLDDAGSRSVVSGAPDAGVYAVDVMNQYVTTSFDARSYDDNGNLTLSDAGPGTARAIVYDFRDREVEFTDAATGQRHTYAYDALGRRIARVVDADGAAQTTLYFYDGSRVVEEQSGGGATEATYVYGRYVDAVLNMRRGGADFYYHADDLFNVRAITDASGTVVDRYEYGDYGEPVDPGTLAPIAGDPSAVGNPYLFTGRRYDPETQQYYYRARYLESRVGRFTARDPLGPWGDEANLGNAYTYVASNPNSSVDPTGEIACAGACMAAIAGGAILVYCASIEFWSGNCVDQCGQGNIKSSHHTVLGFEGTWKGAKVAFGIPCGWECECCE